MDLFNFISRHFWLIAIVVSIINYLAMNAWMDDEDRAVDSPLRRRYQAWMWGLSCVPWLVVGAGTLAGEVPSVWALFRPQDGNPFVLAFYAAGVLCYLFIAWWVFFQDGARIAAELRLFKFQTPRRRGAMNEFWIKAFTVAGLPFIAFVFWMLSRAPLPHMPP